MSSDQGENSVWGYALVYGYVCVDLRIEDTEEGRSIHGIIQFIDDPGYEHHGPRNRKKQIDPFDVSLYDRIVVEDTFDRCNVELGNVRRKILGVELEATEPGLVHLDPHGEHVKYGYRFKAHGIVNQEKVNQEKVKPEPEESNGIEKSLDKEPICAHPGCYERFENRYGNVCEECGSFFCEEHLQEQERKRRCDLCRTYDTGKHKVRQHQCTDVAWTHSNDLVSILNKMGAKGWVLLKILSTGQRRPDVSDGEMINFSRCVFMRERV